MINNQPLDTADLFNSGSYFSLQSWRYFFALLHFSPSPHSYPFLHLPHRLAFIGQTGKKLAWNVSHTEQGKGIFQHLVPSLLSRTPHSASCSPLLTRKIMRNNNTVTPVMQAPFLSKQASSENKNVPRAVARLQNKRRQDSSAEGASR